MIRAKTAADADGLIALMWTTHTHDAYPRFAPSEPDLFVNPPGELAGWVDDDAGVVTGHVALHNADDPAVRAALGASEDFTLVARLMVHPSRRGTGLGTRLLATAVELARQQGRRVALDVDVAATGAIALYEHLGWTRTGAVTLNVHDGRQLDLWVYLAPDV